jgi:cyclopropane-fatty-acyl-phospholipid synthase
MEQDLIQPHRLDTAGEVLSWQSRLARRLLFSQLNKLEHGRLRIVDQESTHAFGSVSAATPLDVTIRVRDARFYADALLAGSTGAGEAFTQGLWDCDNLVGLVRLMIINRDSLNAVDSRWSRITEPLLKAAHWLNRNTVEGSRRNIAAHYDLGNDFFKLFLDDTMAYSCGIFESSQSTLREASIAKFDAACSKLALKPGQHLLEIGTGWGGLAIHAARQYGCKVTSTTISREQYDYACEQVAREGLEDRVTLLLEDYRNLSGQYDALVSIEMVEAVGHQYLNTYLAKCSSLLKDDGAMLLQAITIQDQFYQQALRSVDFIKRYIFPGSFIPSVESLVEATARATDMKLFHMEDIGPHYALTLKAWRERLNTRLNEAKAQGHSDSFLRMWEYYLCYCEGGFEERQLGDVQMLLTKPRSRRTPLATIHAPSA